MLAGISVSWLSLDSLMGGGGAIGVRLSFSSAALLVRGRSMAVVSAGSFLAVAGVRCAIASGLMSMSLVLNKALRSMSSWSIGLLGIGGLVTVSLALSMTGVRLVMGAIAGATLGGKERGTTEANIVLAWDVDAESGGG